MKKFTLIFSLMVAMFTTTMAQESVDLSTGTFGGEYNGDKELYSQWTSDNGVTIVSTDGNSDTETATMKYYNGFFQLNITTDVTNPSMAGTKYTITVPEGYTLTGMIVINGFRKYYTSIDYGYTTLNLYDDGKTPTEKTITFPAGETSFYLRSESERPYQDFIKIKELTITKVGGDNEGEGDEETSINEVTVENAKVIYDLTGRRVNEITESGIYIINGKKVIK